MSGRARLIITLFAGLFFGLCASPSDAVNIERVRHASGDSYTRVVIDVDGTANYRAAFANAEPGEGLPRRFYIDFNGSGSQRRLPGELAIGDSRVDRVRVGQFDEQTARVVIDLRGAVRPRVFALDNPARVVVDLEDPSSPVRNEPTPNGQLGAMASIKSGLDERRASVGAQVGAAAPAVAAPAKPVVKAPAPAPVKAVAKPVSKPKPRAPVAPKIVQAKAVEAPAPKPVALGPAIAIAKPRPDRRWRIVVDPGHGGSDPGALGPKGQREKDVTLAVSLKLAEKLRRGLDADVIMTRTNDKTMTLAERKDVANIRDVDLFISVHANASTNKAAHGIETYYLKNTNDRATLRLAKLENGTGSLIKGGDVSEDADLPFILSDMVQGSKEADSIALARRIQRELVSSVRPRYKDIRDLGVKQGPFFVLDGTHMPSVLVETGFISHNTEGRRMSSASYQETLAEGIYRGIRGHLADESVAGVY